MMHPDSEVQDIDISRGTGVVATRHIPEGTLVWIPGETDQILSLQQVSAMPEKRKAYLADFAYLTNEGTYIVSNDIARFVNHSCDANCLSVAGLEISIAVRDIQEGEEITEDYGLYYANGGFENCICGSSACRHNVSKDDVRQYGEEWDRKIFTSFSLVATVKQPLWPYISLSVREQIEAILTHEIDFPSCKTLKCSPAYLQQAGELLWPSTKRS